MAERTINIYALWILFLQAPSRNGLQKRVFPSPTLYHSFSQQEKLKKTILFLRVAFIISLVFLAIFTPHVSATTQAR